MSDAIIVAIIGLVGTLSTAIMNNWTVIFPLENRKKSNIRYKLSLIVALLTVATSIIVFTYQDRTPILDPIVTIIDVRDANRAQIDYNNAPFHVQVRGNSQNALKFFVYLVVGDSNALWIQPEQSLGLNTNGDFVADCYLGIKDDPASLNKSYHISAVVTDQSYSAHTPLNKKTVLAQSKAIVLFRTK